MTNWFDDAIFYHIYPLGLCGAPERNDFNAAPQERLNALYGWLDHIGGLGCNALYLGPLFESTRHGYDTADYYHVDRRLGTRQTLAAFVREAHRRGLRVVLDGVFNHTGRDFWAFRDILARGQESPYCGWYAGLRFDARNRSGDPFCYETWAGHESLPRLNLHNPAVREHLLLAVEQWMNDYEIDGLRLDAADVVEPDFLRALSAFCRQRKPDFWLMGEVVHGDYTRWANPQALHTTTNYEAYKGLYSSLNEANYFEIAYALNRQFGEGGVYRGLGLYNFVDNHDVNRVASQLKSSTHLYPLYVLLFTMPGVPSVYYGSEFGLKGEKGSNDAALRPALNLPDLAAHAPQPGLPDAIRRLANLRRDLPALRRGTYRQVHVAAQQLVFLRELEGQRALVALNAAPEAVRLEVNLPGAQGWLPDALNPGQGCTAAGGRLQLELPACWGRVLV